MTTLTGKTIEIYTLSNTSRWKGNQTMKFDQLIEYKVKMFFFQGRAENEAGKIVTYLFLFFKKNFTQGKSTLVPIYFGRSQLEHIIKTNCIKFSELLVQRYIQSFFFKKVPGASFSTIFFYDFLRKIFIMLYFNSWPNFIAMLPLLDEINIYRTINILNKYLFTLRTSGKIDVTQIFTEYVPLILR